MKPRQRGAALVAALATAAVAATLAAGLLSDQDRWIRQVEVARDAAQARVGLRAGIAWASALLREDARHGAADHLREPWATRLPPTRFDAAEIEGRIVDEQGRYNVNNRLRADGTADAREVARFRRLVVRLGLPERLADRIPDRPVTDLADLAAATGLETGAVLRLAPYATALPRRTRINVNTAPAEVLELIGADVTPAQAAAIVAERDRAPFRDAGDFANRMNAAGVRFDADTVGAATEFFRLDAAVRHGLAQATATALLERPGNGWPVVVWQRFE